VAGSEENKLNPFNTAMFHRSRDETASG